MTDDFASLDDWRWRAMTNDRSAVQVDALSHLSCARQSAVIRHRAPLAFHAMRVVRSAMDN
ncbi:MAG: hypothetical protein Q4G71_11685 [Pseudomonadota bacterium]|nr:hypothetical protein [Pseudomonadota bacterium]